MGRDGKAFVFGAAAYPLAEVCWRGRSHWTMAMAGGICMVMLCRHHRRLQGRPCWARCLAGAGVITGVELAFGLVCNRALHWGVWDYSALPLNLWGQVCLPFSLLWAALCFFLQPVLGFFAFAPAAKPRQGKQNGD